MASLDFRGEWTLHFKAQIISSSTILRPQCSYTSYIQKPVKMNIAGDDEQDGAITGGPFSALCASMRPGEEEREPGEEEVAQKVSFPRFNIYFRWRLRGRAQMPSHCTDGTSLGFELRRRTALRTPRASSSPSHSPRSFLNCDGDMMVRGG